MSSPEFVHPVIMSGTTEQSSLGNSNTRRYRRVGVATFQIFVPRNTGTTRVRKLADKLSVIFVGKKLDDITFFSGEYSDVGDMEEFFQGNMVVRYQWDKCVSWPMV